MGRLTGSDAQQAPATGAEANRGGESVGQLSSESVEELGVQAEAGGGVGGGADSAGLDLAGRGAQGDSGVGAVVGGAYGEDPLAPG